MIYKLFQRSLTDLFGFHFVFLFLKKKATGKLRIAKVLTDNNVKSQGCSGTEMRLTDCLLVGFYRVVKKANLEAAGKMFCRKALLLL